MSEPSVALTDGSLERLSHGTMVRARDQADRRLSGGFSLAHWVATRLNTVALQLGLGDSCSLQIRSARSRVSDHFFRKFHVTGKWIAAFLAH